MAILYSTDDNSITATVYNDGTAYNIPTDATVTMSVQDSRSSTKILSDITILSSDTGNDWTNGVVKGIFNDTVSSALAAYDFKEVKVVLRITTTDNLTQSYVEYATARKLL